MTYTAFHGDTLAIRAISNYKALKHTATLPLFHPMLGCSQKGSYRESFKHLLDSIVLI